MTSTLGWVALAAEALWSGGGILSGSPAPPPGLPLLESVRITLATDPMIRLQDRETQIAQGRWTEERGRFDARLSSVAAHELRQQTVSETRSVTGAPGLGTGSSLARLIENETAFRAGIDKPLRSGVVVGPAVEFQRLDDNLSGLPPQNRAEINFKVIIPLGQGLGKEPVTARERSAQMRYQAARLAYVHVVAERVLNTALAYWAYVAVQRRLEVLADSGRRALELLQNTRDLIATKEVAQAELDQLTANLAEKTRVSIGATQELFEARQQLGLAIGIPFQDFAGLPTPSDPFPAGHDSESILELAPEFLVGLAEAGRRDLQARRLEAEAARALVVFAKDNLKPQVDLTLQVGYGGYEQGHRFRDAVGAYTENVPGPSALAALRFDWPWANQAARGRYEQQEALYEQQQILVQESSRTIQSGVVVAFNRLQSGWEEVMKSQVATNAYWKAVGHEKEKRRLGISTFSDVILAEDRLTSASIENIRTQLQHANALVQLRFETGTLLEEGPAGPSVSVRRLITAPSSADRPLPTPSH